MTNKTQSYYRKKYGKKYTVNIRYKTKDKVKHVVARSPGEAKSLVFDKLKKRNYLWMSASKKEDWKY